MDERDATRGTVDVLVEHDSLSVPPPLFQRTLSRVFAGENVDMAVVRLILAGHAVVRHLNRRFLDHDYDTDVLAFRYSDPPEPLEGEIYVDLDTARERHAEFDATFEQEVVRYAIHGALHLAGYHDTDEVARQRMRRAEDRYLHDVGLL